MSVTRRTLFAWAGGAASAALLSARAVGAVPALSLASQVDAVVAREMALRRIPGMTLAVVRGGDLLHLGAYGRADLEFPTPMSPRGLFQSASTGKIFTAAAILLLVRDGRLQLDDPVTRHLAGAPPAWNTVTLRHMLAHRSGIADIAPGLLDAQGRPLDPALDYDDAALLAAFARWPLDFAPGSRYRYSNTAYVLLGLVIKAVSGRFYGDLLRERIFAPAGMPTAQVNDIYAVVPGRVRGFLAEPDGPIIRPYIASRSLSRIADGSLLFAAQDWIAWATALRSGAVLTAAELAESWRPMTFSDGTAPVVSYGLGWFLLDVRGRRLLCHHGIWQGFSAWIGHYPGSDLTIAMMCNLESGHPGQFAAQIAGLVDPVLGPMRGAAGQAAHHAAISAWLARGDGDPAHRRAMLDFGAAALSAAPELVETQHARFLYRVRNPEMVGLVELTEQAGGSSSLRMSQAWPAALYETGATPSAADQHRGH